MSNNTSSIFTSLNNSTSPVYQGSINELDEITNRILGNPRKIDPNSELGQLFITAITVFNSLRTDKVVTTTCQSAKNVFGELSMLITYLENKDKEDGKDNVKNYIDAFNELKKEYSRELGYIFPRRLGPSLSKFQKQA